VACAGQDYASHAEVVSIPQNLVAKIPDGVSFEEASFTTLGAIALQGVRQADPKLGENICVIGLGLLGQITCQLLKANGCNVFGIDFSEEMVNLSKTQGALEALNRKDSNLLTAVSNFTRGKGFDSIIITAAAPTNDPVELSAEIAAKKAKVVVVGAVKMDIPRDPHFYRKELELKMSCSYGPGRYDVNYEELGIDYPYAYVRWTEQRNMEAFLDLLAKKAINLEPLITHVFDIGEAEKAYDIVLGKTKEPHIGILLHYKQDEKTFASKIALKEFKEGKLSIGFIGAGSFAQSYLIPNINTEQAHLNTVVTTKGITSKNVADKFKFSQTSTNPKDVFSDEKINTVFIATPHNSHAQLTIDALKSKKDVFVEKPLAMNLEELNTVREEYMKSNNRIMVGFNRRFSPLTQQIKDNFQNMGEPLVVNIRVNAGYIPKDHWTQLENVGGGRIVGEMCHFVDLMQFFTEGRPISVFADSIDTQNSDLTTEDNVSVVIKFDNGSIGNLLYLANGDKSVPKEHIEVYGGGITGIIHDFRSGVIHRDNRSNKIKISGKGHKQEVSAFVQAIVEGKDSPVSFQSIYDTTLTTFKIQDSLRTGLPQKI
ncbi:MAG: bi-domain-containing oxidoreductase, partial [Flavobacteriaceae bacterium]